MAYTAEELWVEFFEDYYERNKTTDIDESDITPEDRVQLVTGDPEVDKVEALLAAEEVDEEAVMRELESWESGGVSPDAKQKAEDLLQSAYSHAEAQARLDAKAAEEVGDGFEDVAPGEHS